MNTRLRRTAFAAVFAFLTPTTSTLHAQVLAAPKGIEVPDGTRKCIKPQNRAPVPSRSVRAVRLRGARSKRQRHDPAIEAESFVIVNPTNPNNLVAFSNLASAEQHLPRVLD